MKKTLLLFILLFGLATLPYLHAQRVSINSDGSNAHPSAMLEIKSTDKGYSYHASPSTMLRQPRRLAC